MEKSNIKDINKDIFLKNKSCEINSKINNDSMNIYIKSRNILEFKNLIKKGFLLNLDNIKLICKDVGYYDLDNKYNSKTSIINTTKFENFCTKIKIDSNIQIQDLIALINDKTHIFLFLLITQNFDNFKLTKQILEKVIPKINHYKNNVIKNIINIMNYIPVIEKEAFEYIIINSEITIEIQKIILNYIKTKNNINYDKKTLLILIIKKYQILFDYLLFEKNIKIDDHCYEAFINQNYKYNNEQYNKIFDGLKFTKSYYSRALQTKNLELIKYLINYKNMKIEENFYDLFVNLELLNIFTQEDLNNILSNFDLNSEHLTIAIKNNNYEIIDYLIDIKNINLNKNGISPAIELLNLNYCKKIFSSSENIEFNISHLLCAIKNKKCEISSYLIKEKKINSNEHCILEYYRNKLHLKNDEELDELIFDNVNFTQLCLDYACQNTHPKGISTILNQNSFYPNFNLCIDSLLKSPGTPNNLNQILLLFYQFGYKLTHDDIINFFNQNIKLDDKLLGDFKPDEKFYITCKYPELCSSACKDIFWLRKLCNEFRGDIKSNNLPKIKRLIKSNNLKPDYKCLENAKNSGELWDFLFDCINFNNIDNNKNDIEENEKNENEQKMENAKIEKKEKKTLEEKKIKKVAKNKKINNPYN